MTPDVLVIGGGLAGCATAYYLAADGVDVTLLEAGDLNTKASGSNAGSLHAQIPYDPFVKNGQAWADVFAPTVGLLARSIEMWRALPALLGVDLEVSLRGGLLVAATEADLAVLERKAAVERRQGLTLEMLDREELRARAPYLSPAMAGGAFCPDEGKANPFAATPAFAVAAARAGARIVRNSPVLGIVREDGGLRGANGRGHGAGASRRQRGGVGSGRDRGDAGPAGAGGGPSHPGQRLRAGGAADPPSRLLHR